MRTFLVEGYFAGGGEAELEALATLADSVARRSPGVRYLGSFVVGADEICLHVFEAPSRGVLERATVDAELAHERVIEASWLRVTA